LDRERVQFFLRDAAGEARDECAEECPRIGGGITSDGIQVRVHAAQRSRGIIAGARCTECASPIAALLVFAMWLAVAGRLAASQRGGWGVVRRVLVGKAWSVRQRHGSGSDNRDPMSPPPYACEFTAAVSTASEGQLEGPDGDAAESDARDRRARSRREEVAGQITPDLCARARAAARRYLGAAGDRASVEDLVQEVLTKTLSGRLAWDPARQSLVVHVCDEVRSHARDQRRWGRKFPHLSIEGAATSRGDDDDDDGAGVLAVLAAETTAAELELRQAHEERTRVLDALRREVASDRAAMVLLNVVGSGSECSSLREASGLSDSDYRFAMRRLRRLVAKLRGGSDDGDCP
jgi:DNA-directed RNA polymerase specialized sigma24 family protein